MAFTKVTAPEGLRNSDLLSADNSVPERHIVIETLRNAAPRIGLGATVISTLDAMLSCLAPQRNHHTVFASNATLTFRRNGISDRTIRRHAAILQETGLLVRRDSPNRKRFTKRSRIENAALRFGFDLSPLFDRFHEIAAIAAEVLSEREQIDYLRAKIRAIAQENLRQDPDNPTANTLTRLLRRKLTLQDCHDILKNLPDYELAAESNTDQDFVKTSILSGSNGQNVRHHHNSNKEFIDKGEIPTKKEPQPSCLNEPVSIQELLTACPEAAKFALNKVQTFHDVISHARTLAPMVGITGQAYEAASQRLGPTRTAITLWAIMQFHEKINSIGAYFRSITIGTKSTDFSPEKLIRRLGQAQRQSV